MYYRRFSLLKFLTPLVACAAFVLGAARAFESAQAAANSAHAASSTDSSSDGMSWCRVNGDTVNIRVGPSTANQPVTTLRSGDYVRAKPALNNWMEIEWPRNVPAWVLRDTIQVTSADGHIGTVRANRARIVSQGMSTAPEVAILDRGAHVSIVAEKGDWYQVQAPPAARAYISAKYVVVGVEPPAPADTVAVPQTAKSTARAQRDTVADTVEIAAAKRDYGETVELPSSASASKSPSKAAMQPAHANQPETNAGEVVVIQQEASWPKNNLAARSVVKPDNAAAVFAPPLNNSAAKKEADQVAFAKAAAEKKRLEEAEAARVSEARHKAEQEELAHIAAEKKRIEETELARKAAESRKAEIDAQTAIAAERKKALESEIEKFADARKKAEAEESARLAADKKRAGEAETARLAAEAKHKLELEEQSRMAAERKRLEDEGRAQTAKKVEIESQTKAAAERKKALEDELAKLSEAKKKAEDEEKARVASEKKRLQDAETARLAAEAKRTELEEQAQKAAEKKRALETEIASLAKLKEKDQADATARAAREKKLAQDAETARVAAETRHKAEQEELTKKEADKKRLEMADAARTAADAKRRADLAEQERAALARKRALEDEIARLYEAKRKAEDDMLARVAADKKTIAESLAAHAAEESKQKAEIVELTKIASDKKRIADEEAARAADARKRADEAESARVAAERKRVEESEADRVATEHKRIEEDAAQKAATRKKADEEAEKLAGERKKAEEIELARIAAEKKRAEEEAARLAAENKRKLDEQSAFSAFNEPAARLPEPGMDDARPARQISLKTDKPVVLDDAELAKDEPTEANYNADYVPLRIREMQKKYVMPPAPKKVVAETIDDATSAGSAPTKLAPAANPSAVPAVPVPESKDKKADGEAVELTARGAARAPETQPVAVLVNDNNFDTEVGQFKGVTLVDFGASWCMPCRRTAPIMDELAGDFKGKVKVVRIDVDQSPALVRRYGISGLPCLVIFNDGKSIDRRVGEPSKEYLKKWVQDSAEPPKSKETGMNVIPAGKRTVVSDVGTLQRISNTGIAGVKYMLLNGDVVSRYIIEPADVDMSAMVGRTISISGTTVGRTYSNTSVMQMKNASTFG